MRQHIGRSANVDTTSRITQIAVALGTIVQANELIALPAYIEKCANKRFYLGSRSLGHPPRGLTTRRTHVRPIGSINPRRRIFEVLPMVKAPWECVDELVEENIAHLSIGLARIDGARNLKEWPTPTTQLLAAPNPSAVVRKPHGRQVLPRRKADTPQAGRAFRKHPIEPLLSLLLQLRTAYLSVAYITALIVCMRFSASSKTRERGPSKTSLVTSISGRPNFS